MQADKMLLKSSIAFRQNTLERFYCKVCIIFELDVIILQNIYMDLRKIGNEISHPAIYTIIYIKTWKKF